MKQPQVENQTPVASYEMAFFEPKGRAEKQPVTLVDAVAGAPLPLTLSDPNNDSDCACT